MRPARRERLFCPGQYLQLWTGDYTEVRERLYDLLDSEYEDRSITEDVYRRIGKR